MVTIEELKLGNRTLEALKFLLSQITELETAISQINISEIKDANTLTKEQIATLQDVKNAVEAISSDLNLKKSDFDEKKQNFDTNMSAFRNDKADFDEKKADFDSKNNTALSNFAFISSNVEKIDSTSALLAEAKTILETIKPIEQRTQTVLDTIANSQAKFAELDALKTTLLELKRSLESISTTGIINDDSASTTTTYSSTKINALTQGVLKNTDASENNTGGKIVRRNAAGNIYATNIYINEPAKTEVSTIKASLTADKWRFLVRNSDEGILKSMSIKDFLAGQEVDAYTRSQSDAKFELKGTAYSKIESDAKYLKKVDKIDAYSKIECNATFLKKTEKIDSYSKTESDDKFALKTELTDGLPIGAYLSYPSQKTVPAGFLLADGRSLKKSEYTELFDVIGYTYGGSGEIFNIPKFDDGRFFRSVGGNAAPLGQLQLGSKIVQAGHIVGNTVENADEIAEENAGVNSVAAPVGSILSNKVRIRPTNSSVVIIIKAKNVNTPTASQIDKTILATETKAGITKLKNAITAKQEDAAVTEKAVSNIVFGIGQTYANVKDVKRINENYENTTGKPILVIVSVYAQTQSYIIANVNDVVVGGIGTGAGGQYVNTLMSFIVPPGARYKLTSMYNATIESWFELR